MEWQCFAGSLLGGLLGYLLVYLLERWHLRDVGRDQPSEVKRLKSLLLLADEALTYAHLKLEALDQGKPREFYALDHPRGGNPDCCVACCSEVGAEAKAIRVGR